MPKPKDLHIPKWSQNPTNHLEQRGKEILLNTMSTSTRIIAVFLIFGAAHLAYGTPNHEIGNKGHGTRHDTCGIKKD
jgi:hypothetical protein